MTSCQYGSVKEHHTELGEVGAGVEFFTSNCRNLDQIFTFWAFVFYYKDTGQARCH